MLKKHVKELREVAKLMKSGPVKESDIKPETQEFLCTLINDKEFCVEFLNNLSNHMGSLINLVGNAMEKQLGTSSPETELKSDDESEDILNLIHKAMSDGKWVVYKLVMKNNDLSCISLHMVGSSDLIQIYDDSVYLDVKPVKREYNKLSGMIGRAMEDDFINSIVKEAMNK